MDRNGGRKENVHSEGNSHSFGCLAPNRHEDHWGIESTGFSALDFVPERWAEMEAQGRGSKETLHFGFGHGPRVCPGKHLSELEVGLVVGAFVKMFRFKADNPAKAGVSTKPLDGTLVDLELR